MRLFRFFGYFSRLRALIGFRAACIFALAHIGNNIHPPHTGRLARIPVGPYVFYFPSLSYFEGLFTEIFFKETYYLAYTQKPIQVIDCGANIGVSLLYIKTRAPHARVTCFEPNPAARAVLEKNIESNNWSSEVQVFPYALGKDKGRADFFVESSEPTSSGGGLGNKSMKDRQHTSYPVEVETLSSFVNEPVDFLKMDIEGGEFGVLEDLVERNAMHQILNIQLEYHYLPGFQTRPLSDLLVFLENNGFRTFVESNTPPHDIIGHNTRHTYMIFAWRLP